jgi:tetratricopeptide (TPR) repeat protein
MKILPMLFLPVLLATFSGCGDPYEEGVQALDQQRWTEAAELFRQVPHLDKRKDDAKTKAATAHFHLGKLSFEKEDWHAVFDHLKAIPRVHDNFQDGRDMLDFAYFHLGKESSDAQEWLKAVERLGMVREGNPHREEARELYKVAVAKNKERRDAEKAAAAAAEGK